MGFLYLASQCFQVDLGKTGSKGNLLTRDGQIRKGLGPRALPYQEIRGPHSLWQAFCLVWNIDSSFTLSEHFLHSLEVCMSKAHSHAPSFHHFRLHRGGSGSFCSSTGGRTQASSLCWLPEGPAGPEGLTPTIEAYFALSSF